LAFSSRWTSSLAAHVTKPVSARRLGLAVARALGQELPLAHGTSPAKRRLPSLAERGARVPLVEDNPANQEVARALLKKLGVACEVCDSGETAPAALPVFDRAGLMERLMDDEELLPMIVASFLCELNVQNGVRCVLRPEP
jgi:hypothetical protein